MDPRLSSASSTRDRWMWIGMTPEEIDRQKRALAQFLGWWLTLQHPPEEVAGVLGDYQNMLTGEVR